MDDFISSWDEALRDVDPEINAKGTKAQPIRVPATERRQREQRQKSDGGDRVEFETSAKELEPLVRALGNVGCRMLDSEQLADGEVSEIARAAAPVMSKYMGAALQKWGPEIALGGVLAKVYTHRAMDYAEKRGRERAEETVSSETTDEF